MSVNNRRSGRKWTINELLTLQREYELLELTVQEIAERHNRSELAILYKLESEELIDSWYNARGFNSENYQNSVNSVEASQEVGGDDDNQYDDDEDYQFEEEEEEEEDDDDISDDESEVEKLTERVWSLETSVSEISSVVKNIFNILSAKQTSKSSKRKPLRTSTSSD